jgi:hypothetical protein
MSWTYWIVFVTFDARRKPAKRLSMLQIFKDLPEPIDLELDPANRTIDWTDRGIRRLETRSIRHRWM